MNKLSFQYCLLKYVHSQLLGESVNIGIFFLFPDGKFYFKYPDNFARIKPLYEDFNEGQLKENLEILRDITFHLNQYGNPEKKDLTNLFREDATVLQTGKVQNCVMYSDNINDMVNGYYNLYFGKQ